jgi:hypothetical protein
MSLNENKNKNFFNFEETKLHEVELLFESINNENNDFKIKNILYKDILSHPMFKEKNEKDIIENLNSIFEWWKKNCNSKGNFSSIN